jgi:NAD+ synthase
MGGEERLMTLLDGLKINPETTAEKIEQFVQKQVKSLNKDGVVIGLSGGLDSSVCASLCSKALGKDKILALILPERDSDPRNIKHAKLVAKNLKLETKVVDLTEILEKIGVYQLISEEERTNRKRVEKLIRRLASVTKTPSTFAAGMSALYSEGEKLKNKVQRKLVLPYSKKYWALIVAKVRLRMLFLYYWASLNNFLVVGTTDKTEWTIGFYDKYGDGANDITLLRHLYKTQIRQLAQYLGIPQEIIEKPSSGDVVAGIPNETVIGLSYEKLDQILSGMEKGMKKKEIVRKAETSLQSINTVEEMIKIEKIRRGMPRYL